VTDGDFGAEQYRKGRKKGWFSDCFTTLLAGGVLVGTLVALLRRGRR